LSLKHSYILHLILAVLPNPLAYLIKVKG